MDQHFLTPLFSPKSIVVFAGDPEQPSPQQPMAAALIASLKASGFAGAITWMSIDQQGTLSELAQSRADLAIIALPHDQLEPALEIAGRIRCRAASVISAGLPQARCATLHAIAKHHGMQLSAPTAWASSARCSSSTPAWPANWLPRGRWGWCRSRVR
ncbi:hypothetical protein VITFI_CDS1615 [Vitreoscilla filiformis]|uniref:Uncharacterized protein n=1 Tax=Vitreoscilla filiformis TaxID=63 RepID=A0A221KF17_VITFI|nr:hypothetical protein [Vitreoscilla filiformis]ASM77393.1 hypothetical protein VITFI_CDS1615 [Vitreoscilla filiformis]